MSYWSICRAFVAGNEVKKSWRTRVRSSKNDGLYGWSGQGPFYSEPGTVRLDVVHDQSGYDRLVSYGRFDLAVRKPDGQIIANGDNAPTMTSRKQQREFRSALGTAKTCLLPFSALRAAGIEPGYVVIVDTTPDREIETWKKCQCEKSWHKESGEYVRVHEDGTHSVKRVAHFLGETLFTREDRPGRYYVSGLDRNDDPSKRHFYLAQLPDGAAPKTVDEALELLKPEGLPEAGWYRQGEWFFVPQPGLKPVVEGENMLIKEVDTYGHARRGVPIISHWADEQRGHFPHSLVLRSRANRHRATRMYINGAVYVSGMVRDEEHTAVKLGNGKTWYRVVRNRAVGSWGAGGQVD
jgi:hypothetical protein